MKKKDALGKAADCHRGENRRKNHNPGKIGASKKTRLFLEGLGQSDESLPAKRVLSGKKRRKHFGLSQGNKAMTLKEREEVELTEMVLITPDISE